MTNPTDSPMVPVGTISHGLAVLGQAERFAEMLSNSQFIPAAYRGKPGDVMACVLYGESLGVPPLQALQGVAVINGRPSVYGDLALAVARAHPEFQDITEELGGKGDDYGATCTVTRRGQTPVVRRFTWKDAERAHLRGKKGPWSEYPQRMLQMRARSWAIRDSFADALCGLAIREETEDWGQTEVVEPRKLTPPAEVPKGRQKATTATVVLPTSPEMPAYVRREAEVHPLVPEPVADLVASGEVEISATPSEDIFEGIGEEPQPVDPGPPVTASGVVIPDRHEGEKVSDYLLRVATDLGLKALAIGTVLDELGVSSLDLDKPDCPATVEQVVQALAEIAE